MIKESVKSIFEIYVAFTYSLRNQKDPKAISYSCIRCNVLAEDDLVARNIAVKHVESLYFNTKVTYCETKRIGDYLYQTENNDEN